MTMEEAGKLPDNFRQKEEQLHEALENLRKAHGEAIRAGERLTEVIQQAKSMLDENNY